MGCRNDPTVAVDIINRFINSVSSYFLILSFWNCACKRLDIIMLKSEVEWGRVHQFDKTTLLPFLLDSPAQTGSRPRCCLPDQRRSPHRAVHISRAIASLLNSKIFFKHNSHVAEEEYEGHGDPFVIMYPFGLQKGSPYCSCSDNISCAKGVLTFHFLSRLKHYLIGPCFRLSLYFSQSWSEELCCL